MKSACLLLAAVFYSSIANAHIGETREECDARYGFPEQVKENGMVFYAKNGLDIAVSFYEGKADCIVYSHKSKDAIGLHEKFSLNEIQILQNANTAGSWVSESENPSAMAWVSPDRLVSCQYMPFKKERPLAIATVEKLKRVAQKNQAAETENLKGL